MAIVAFEETQPPQLQFSCYLMRSDISDPIDALRASSRPGGEDGMYEATPAADAQPQGIRAFLALNRGVTPPWANALSSPIPDLQQVQNTSSRLVLFLPVSGRWFAICFGYGNASLKSNAIESNFGLSFAARSMRTDDVSEFASRRIDATARTQSVQSAGGSTLADLDIPLLGEFVRKLSGKLDETFTANVLDVTAVIASDSIAFSVAADLVKVQEVLALMLSAVENQETKSEFEFVDALEPLRATDNRVGELESALAQDLTSLVSGADVGSLSSFIGVAPPDEYNLENIHLVRVSAGENSVDLPDFSLKSVIGALGQLRPKISRASLTNIRVSTVNVNGDSGATNPLKAWLAYERETGPFRFILAIGRWFALKKGFSDQLDSDIAALPNTTAVLGLPNWPATKSKEAEYNEFAEDDQSKFMMFDRVRIYSDGDQIEACDLLSKAGHFIHVKRWDKSGTLSHLFAQGLVSHYVLNRDPKYLADFQVLVRGGPPDYLAASAISPRQVVYAIAVAGARDIPGSLPTFSKVNLRDYMQRLSSAGARGSVARIQMD